jgi:cobalt-zinc-cadmium efflux system membrane fusion protein
MLKSLVASVAFRPKAALCHAFFLLAAAGCSHAESEALKFSPGTAQTSSAGVVKLNPASRKFIDLATIGADSAPALVQSPGRVAFRDGAVAKVGAPVHGRVIAITVHVGDPVHKGQHLVTLSSPDAATMSADLARAEVAARASVAEAQRQRDMLNKGVGIQSDLVAAQAHADEAKAELERARTALAFLGQAHSGIIEVRAPIDGNVLALHATLGGTAQPDGDPLVELGDPNALWMVTEVFERELPLVRIGALATAQVASMSEPVRLHVLNVGAAVDPATRRAPAYLAFDELEPTLRSGMYARVAIEAKFEGGVAVPASAVLVKDGGRTYIYVALADGTFRSREVTVGHPVDGRVPVFTGLRPGEQIVVKGALLLDTAAEQLL